MSRMILTADWHLTDAPLDEYRWGVFAQVEKLAARYPDAEVFMLGDLCDRKDRHAASLVNRVVRSFIGLGDALSESGDPRGIHILPGNHDMPVRGRSFWSFLSELQPVAFYDDPYEFAPGHMLLPWTANPREAWRDFDLGRMRSVFMHQPQDGAVGENGQKLSIATSYLFSRRTKVYSGDIHTPQQVGPVTYVGAPHAIKFGDDYQPRMLVLNPDFSICEAVAIRSPQKVILRARNTGELETQAEELALTNNDMVRIRYALALEQAAEWDRLKECVLAWGNDRKLTIVSVEAEVVGAAQTRASQTIAGDHYMTPSAVLEAFSDAQQLDPATRQAGQMLLERASYGGSP